MLGCSSHWSFAIPDAVVTVHAAFDDEAGVWFVESSDLHGVNAEASTLDALVAKLPDVVFDLLDEKDAATTEDIALEIVAHRRSAVRVEAGPDWPQTKRQAVAADGGVALRDPGPARLGCLDRGDTR